MQIARQTVKVPAINEAVKLLRQAKIQRQATAEHRRIMAKAAFERDVKARLAKIESLLGADGQHQFRIAFGRRAS
jgi:hypothetical protein